MTRRIGAVGAPNAVDPKGADPDPAGRREASSQALIPAGPVVTHAKAGPPDDPPGGSVFAAQLFGQTGRKRGLKGGPPVLVGARSAYLEAEFSGPSDRRIPPGKMTKTEI